MADLYVKTKKQFDDVVKDNVLVAVDFTASWCPPCRMIGPKFEAMQADFPSIKFIKIDVDDNSETAEAFKVSAMPTFKFIKNGKEVDELVGASEEKLKQKLHALAA